MNKSRLAIFIDCVLVSIIIFIMSFFWLRKYIKSAFFLIFSSISISLLVFFMLFRHLYKKFNFNKISLKEENHLKLCINSLKLFNQKLTIDFFENLLSCKHKINNFFENNKFIYYINLRTKLTATDFYSLLDLQSNNKPIIILCEQFDDDFKSLVSTQNNYFLFLSKDIYPLMRIKNLFPQPIKETQTIKQILTLKLKTFLSTITRVKFKDYFFSGVSLLLLSFFIPYSIYYAITGTFLLFISILCLFKPIIKNSTTANIDLINLIKK